jgi:maltooligosyltrehalose trehalohydrolase
LSNKRKFAVGTEFLIDEQKFHFRVWVPECKSVSVYLISNNAKELCRPPVVLPLTSEKNGYFSGFLSSNPENLLYGFILDDLKNPFPDPASRFQPFGIGGLSGFINPYNYTWRDSGWNGIPAEGRVFYEMHIGTFTPQGTWQAATSELGELARIGITVLEIMPVAEFFGIFNWGYDGIFQFAPSNVYGTPDDFRNFVDTAHQCGISVLLDVVYNHLGRRSSFFKNFSRHYFSNRYTTIP